MSRIPSRFAVLALAAALSACAAVGPDYHAPEAPPVAIANAQSAAFVTQNPEAAWWRGFDDPVLDRLVTRALEANLDLRVAVDRVLAARAVFDESSFDRGPHVQSGASYASARQQVAGTGSERVDVESAQIGFDARWEIDLFGHVRRSIEAARADLGASEAALRDAQVTVAAEVARQYFQLRSVQKRLDIARRDLAAEQKTTELTQVRYDAGRVTELDVQRAIGRLHAVEATIPQLQAAEKRGFYRIAVLLGENPGALDDSLVAVESAPWAKALPIGDVSDLLRRRPDVRIAERELAAATARVGVATADLFPRVHVSGFVGFLSGDLGPLFASGGGTDTSAWSITPSVTWPAFDLGSVRARLRASEARSDAAAARYELAVRTALEDTENRFVEYAAQQTRLRSLGGQAEASRRAAELAGIQYREGVTDFLTLLDAQRTLLEAEDAVAQAQGDVNVSVVGIYKALGGGAL